MAYFKIGRVLSYNALLNIIMADRGSGKSYGVLSYLLERYLDHGEEFAYLRRTDKETGRVKEKLFPEILENSYPEIAIRPDGDKFYLIRSEDPMNKELIGHNMALNQASQYKSATFYKVKNILFDEFIAEDGKYLKEEVSKFLSLCETICRLKKVRIFLLGNTYSLINPYFLELEIDAPFGKKFWYEHERSILVHYFKNDDYQQAHKESPIGKLLKGTRYGDFALSNDAIGDKTDGIEKPEQPLAFKYNLVYKKNNYLIYVDFFGRTFIIAGSENPDGLTVNMDKTFEIGKWNRAKSNPAWESLRNEAASGNVIFNGLLERQAIGELIYGVY